MSATRSMLNWNPSLRKVKELKSDNQASPLSLFFISARHLLEHVTTLPYSAIAIACRWYLDTCSHELGSFVVIVVGSLPILVTMMTISSPFAVWSSAEKIIAWCASSGTKLFGRWLWESIGVIMVSVLFNLTFFWCTKQFGQSSPSSFSTYCLL